MLPLNDKTLNNLKEIHPESKNANNNIYWQVLHRDPPTQVWRYRPGKAAIKTKGRSGPSALEADRSWRIVCSKNFADINVNLSKSNSKFYQGALHRKSVNCFFWSISCLLIHFSWYKPGFPIAVGEILGRITGKVIV